MVQTLLAAGARLADEDSTGYTALDHAVLHGQQAAAQCLLEAGAKASLNSHRTREGLTCLAIAILAGHAHIVRLLLGAGADPSLAALHSSENALFFLIRTAAAKYQLQTAAKSGEVFDPYMEMCTMLLSAGLASFLNSVTNSAGLTAAYLAATLDLPQILGLLVQHGADPWALSPPAPAGVPANKEVLQALHGTAAPGSAPVESWTVVHEAARTGAVRSLETLLALREQQRQQQQQKEEDPFKRHTCASVERDALVGSLCGGCLPAAQLGLDRCRLGLYPEEMTAALELCRASEAAWPGPPSLAAVVDGVTASPLAPQQTQLTGTFESVASYVQSRPHIYLNWETQVLPALHSADLVSVVAWITDDRVGVPHDKVAGPLATKALHALVTGPAMGAHQSETVVLITQALLQARADPHFAWSLEGTGMQGFTLLMQVGRRVCQSGTTAGCQTAVMPCCCCWKYPAGSSLSLSMLDNNSLPD
jgi:ankyrin repeat protein